MKFLENLLYGSIMTIMHVMLFFVTSYFILAYNDLTVIGTMFFFLIVTYYFNWKYNDCFLSIWEAEYTNFYAANVASIALIPCFSGTHEDTAVAGSALVMALLIFVGIKFFVPLIQSLIDAINKNKETNDRQQKKERRRND
jgi:hypothetical protein